MALKTIKVYLRAWRWDGKLISTADFFDRLILGPGDPVKRVGGPGALRIELLSLADEDFSAANEPSEALALAIRHKLTEAAEWLEKQSTTTFRDLRQAGTITDVFIGAWIDQDQIDLSLPPEFLKACGLHGLTVELISND